MNLLRFALWRIKAAVGLFFHAAVIRHCCVSGSCDPALSWCVFVCCLEDDVPLKSPSMLHRLLTLPSQLVDGDDESMELEESLLNAITSLHAAQTPHHDTARAEDQGGGQDLEDHKEEEEEEEANEEETKLRSGRSGRKNHVCKTCGRKFSRAHLLKAHRLTHKDSRSSFSKLHTSTNTGKNSWENVSLREERNPCPQEDSRSFQKQSCSDVTPSYLNHVPTIYWVLNIVMYRLITIISTYVTV